MGTWGTGPFENDDALDFFREAREDGPVALEEAFDIALEPDEDLPAPEGARAVAAVALLAAWLGGNRAALPQGENTSWLDRWPPQEAGRLRLLGRDALARVQTPPSELRDLWEESVDFGAWQEALGQLGEVLD